MNVLSAAKVIAVLGFVALMGLIVAGGYDRHDGLLALLINGIVIILVGWQQQPLEALNPTAKLDEDDSLE